MHILLTRPLEDSKDLIAKFKFLGHRVSHLPVIEIKSLNYEALDYLDYKGIIFTSSNAVKNLNSKSIDKKIYCFCVGSATEKFAKQSGFQNTYSADGNVNNLKEIILQNFDYNQGSLLYVSGEIISNDLESYSPKKNPSPSRESSPISTSIKIRMKPSQKKEFKPTPTPPPLENKDKKDPRKGLSP